MVDDQSTDRTRDIASSFSRDRVQVIAAGEVPPGWTGKNNAVTAGAKAARGEWLLFTDADTIHLPGSLARSLEEAKRQHAALLSYSPEQIVKGFWEKAVMPVIFAELAASFRPSEVSDPNSPAAAANGQYILITREAYDAVGGHAAIAASLLEDVALARAVKQSGRKIFFRYGGDAVRTRMYRSFAQLREGWTKNLALLFPSPVTPGSAAGNRVRSDRSQLRHQPRHRAPRTPPARRVSGNAGHDLVRPVPQANPPRSFLLGRKPPGHLRTPTVFLSPAALEKSPRQGKRALEGPQLF